MKIDKNPPPACPVCGSLMVSRTGVGVLEVTEEWALGYCAFQLVKNEVRLTAWQCECRVCKMEFLQPQGMPREEVVEYLDSMYRDWFVTREEFDSLRERDKEKGERT